MSSIKLTPQTIVDNIITTTSFGLDKSKNNNEVTIKYNHNDVHIAYGTGFLSYQYLVGLSNIQIFLNIIIIIFKKI